MRHRKPAQARLGFRPAARRRLVADFAAGAGRRSRVRRDRGGMVVGLAFQQGMGQFRAVAVAVARVWVEARNRPSLHHRGVIRIGDHRSLRVARMRDFDHPEERFLPRSAVDDPRGVEYLVPAMLGVRLREHGQLRIGRIAPDAAVVRKQVVDLVPGQRKTQLGVGLFQRGAAARKQVHERKRLRLVMAKQRVRLIRRVERRFGHAIAQQLQDWAALCVDGAAPRKKPGGPALDAAHRREPAAMRDVGRLGRPRGNRTEARHDQEHVALGRRGSLPVLEQLVEHVSLAFGQRPLELDKMPVFGRIRLD